MLPGRMSILKDDRGNVAMIFAIAMVPVVVAAGGAVDYSRAVQLQMTVQDALDSAALAAGREIGVLTNAQLHDKAEDYYLANLGGKLADPPEMTTTITGASIKAKATLVSPNSFLGIVGIDDFTFDLSAQVTSGIGTLEVAMALDNSGSMGGTKISTLRSAATDLAKTLFALAGTSTKPDPIKIGLVPFAAAVNVGPGYGSAAWMDTTGVGSYHGDSMDGSATTVNDFTLLSMMKNQSWAGCVEERKAPYDVSDDEATPATPATMFVPMFAPDEPDNWTCSTKKCSYSGKGSNRAYSGAPSGSQSYNNYLPDNGGNCSGSTDTAKTNSSNEQAAFARTCKYKGATPSSITVNGYSGGPNLLCTTTAVTPLSTSESSVTNAIKAMQAKGMTNIMSGLMWGWRVLSPAGPLSGGRGYGDTENEKMLILMTDGENTYRTNGTFLKSDYGAWGYVSMGHLGTTSTSQVTDKMDERTALACTNAKAAGIKIYTVAFQVSDTSTLAMLKTCATDASMAFQSSSTSALTAAFQAIGDDISMLRVSE